MTAQHVELWLSSTVKQRTFLFASERHQLQQLDTTMATNSLPISNSTRTPAPNQITTTAAEIVLTTSELLQNILRHIPKPYEIWQAREVCRAWRDIIEDWPGLRAKVEFVRTLRMALGKVRKESEGNGKVWGFSQVR
jgi:hypothetical protein